MKRGKLAQGVAVATTLLLVVLLVSFYFTSRSYLDDVGTITLPDENGGISVGPGDVGDNGPLVDGVEVTPGNVQNVIRTLRRPDQYTFAATATSSYYNAKATRHVTGTVKEQRRLLQVADGSGTKKILLNGDSYYVWWGNASNPQRLARGHTRFDEDAGIPTYEDVLALAPADITDAGYAQKDGVACIYVTAQNRIDNALGGSAASTDTYYIAVESGLLYAAESRCSGLTSYTMQLTDWEKQDVADDVFQLPNGHIIGNADAAGELQLRWNSGIRAEPPGQAALLFSAALWRGMFIFGKVAQSP